MAKESIDQLARRLAESLPQGFKAVRTDMEKNFRSILGAGLARLDLVTREEFEVQEAVLSRNAGKAGSADREARRAGGRRGEETGSEKGCRLYDQEDGEEEGRQQGDKKEKRQKARGQKEKVRDAQDHLIRH